MDPIGKTTKAIDHNRYTFIGIAIGLALTGAIIGCDILQGKAIDPVSGKKMSSADIATSVNSELGKIDLQINMLVGQRDAMAEQGQSAVDQAVAQTQRNYAMVDAATGMLLNNPIVAASGFGAAVTGIAGITGLWRDNRRKDGVIKSKAGDSA